MDQKEELLRNEYAEIEDKLRDPNIYSDPAYPRLAKRQKYLEETLALFKKGRGLARQMEQAQELAKSGDESMADLARVEILDLEGLIEQNDATLREALIPKDPNDNRDIVMEIRAAAGGDEASLFAGDL